MSNAEYHELNSDCQKLVDNGYDDVIVFSNPDYNGCLVGVSSNAQAIYDYNKMITFLVENHYCENDEEAADFISYNDSFNPNGEYPIIMFELE